MSNDFDSMMEQLQKETNERLKKQDHIIAKLEKKIDKMQQQNHSQMSTLDVRMQQMMGMFQMFMMNQTIGMNQNQNQIPNQTQQTQKPPPSNRQLSSPPNLEQSKSALDVTPQSSTNAKKLHIAPKTIYKSRSIGNLEDANPSDSDYDSDMAFSAEGEEDHEPSHSRSRRRKHKRKSKKERKKDKKERKREKRKQKHRDKKDKEKDKDKKDKHDNIPIFNEEDLEAKTQSPILRARDAPGTARPVPPPPPKDLDDDTTNPKPLLLNKRSSSHKNGAVPPPRDGTEGREGRERSKKHNRYKKSKHREHSTSRSRHKKHEKSQSEDVKLSHHRKHHKKKQKTESEVNVVDFVAIDTNYGNESPTKSESGLLDKLDTLELDVETPSDEESLLYLVDDQLEQKEDESYEWAAKKRKSKRRKYRSSDSDGDADDESGDDDISILSLSKQPGLALLDGEDLGDSDYSGYDEGDADNHSSDTDSSEDKRKERKKQKKRDKKRRKKEAKKREKRRKKEKHNDDSSSAKALDMSTTNKAKLEDEQNKKKTGTISKKIKQIQQKFKKGNDDNNTENTTNRNKSTTFKDMFKGKSKAKGRAKHKDDSSASSGRMHRAKTSATLDEIDKKKKKFGGLRSFKERQFSYEDKVIDDHGVNYGDRSNLVKKNSIKRRQSDSQISNMELSARDSWYGDRKKKTKFAIETEGLTLQPDIDSNMTPPPSPFALRPSYVSQISDEDDEEEQDSINSEEQEGEEDDNDSLEIAEAKLEDEEVNSKKNSSIDEYTKSRGSKSASKDIVVSDDIEEGLPLAHHKTSDDYDPDIDVGDYDWNSYSGKTTHKTKPKQKQKPKPKAKAKTKAKGKGKGKAKSKVKPPKSNPKLQKTQSDEDIPRKKQSKTSKSKAKSKQANRPARPHSARVGSNLALSKKDKEEAKNKHAFFKEKSKSKKTKDKDKTNKKKKKKPKNINIITEHKKLKQKKRKPQAMTPTPNRRRDKDKKGAATPTPKAKRGSARIWDGDRKKKPKTKDKKPTQAAVKEESTDNEDQAMTGDDSKEPEVLDHARGQSVYNALYPAQKGHKSREIEYMFGHKQLKAIVPKMNYEEHEKGSGAPQCAVTIQHVIGYMGYDNLCRNNLSVLNNGQLVYNVGCLAVIHDVDRNEQKIYPFHEAPITSITVLEAKEWIATSSYATHGATIRIWDKNTLNTIAEIRCTHLNGHIRHLTFSPCSNLLYATCGEKDRNTNVLAFTVDAADNEALVRMQLNTIPNKTVQIYGLIFNSSVSHKRWLDEFVVFGSNILYWCQTSKKNGRVKYCKVNKLLPKGSTEGKKEKAYHCGLFLKSNYYALGGQSGTVYIGHKNTIIMSLPAHSSRIQSIVPVDDDKNEFISIGHDGAWKIWNIDYDDAKMKEISQLLMEHSNEDSHSEEEEDEYEEKRSIPDYSSSIIKCGAISVICEDSFVPSNDNISKHAHAASYDMKNEILYVGTACNSIVAVSCIDVKRGYGDNDLQIISCGHSLGVVGVAISPKLDTLIATLSEDGLLRLWNIFKSKKNTKHKTFKNKENKAKRLDNCVALQSLISGKQQNQHKLKSTVIAWSPDGKYLATGYNVSKVSLCTAHPLKKVQEIDLSQYKNKGKNISSKQCITALCFSYDKNVLAVAHCTQLSLFNVERNSNKKCTKWDVTLNVCKDNIKHLYFSHGDMLCVISEKYDTKFYNVSMKKKSITEATGLPKADVVWWPRIPLTSFILKGLYQKDTVIHHADICPSLKVVASADTKGVIRLHKLPALNAKAHNAFKHHHGKISKILFIPHQSILISVGLNDRSIIRWNINEL
eukprot:32081_1